MPLGSHDSSYRDRDNSGFCLFRRFNDNVLQNDYNNQYDDTPCYYLERREGQGKAE
jgi:hypothetical protein